MSQCMPEIVMLHDVEHGDWGVLKDVIKFDAPYRMHSYTDTYPDANSHNSTLKDIVFFKTDEIFIQERLVELGTSAVKTVIGTALITSCRRAIVHIFDDDYGVKTLAGRDFFKLRDDVFKTEETV